MRRMQRDIAGGVLISKDGKIFLGKHGGGGAYQGCWIIPGGGIDDGETAEEALHREMMEETGIDITGCDIELVNTAEGESEKTLKTTGETVIVEMKFNDFRVQLTVNAADTPPAPTDELAESRWFAIEELNGLTFSPPTKALFQKLGYLA